MARTVRVEPNYRLDANKTKVFLTGDGYAPRATVRDGRGDTVFTGPAIFLQNDASYASDGVIRVPDAQPTQRRPKGSSSPSAPSESRAPTRLTTTT